MAQTARYVVNRADVDMLLTELREQPQDAVYAAALLAALLVAMQTLDTMPATQRASPTTTELILTAEHAGPFRIWLASATLRASRASYHGKAQAFKRVYESHLRGE